MERQVCTRDLFVTGGSDLISVFGADDIALSQTHLFVEMMCNGCANGVRRVLTRMDDVDNVEIDLEKKRVIVTGKADEETLLAAIRKTGKACHVLEK